MSCAVRGATLTYALLAGVLAALPATAAAQAGGDQPAGARAADGIPGATFGATFRKYTPPATVYSPFYSWDASMRLGLAIARVGDGAVTFTSEFQSVGTESFGSTVSVGGVGYLVGIEYIHVHSRDFRLSTGVAHLSSHLTRDLDRKLEEERSRGASIPIVADPDQYNIAFVKGYRRLPEWPLMPEIELTLQPVNVRAQGLRPVRPVLVRSRLTIWQASGSSLAAETQHELGSNPFNTFAVVLGFDSRDGPHRRLQLVVSGSPGDELHVSPTLGGLRDGLAVGLRIHVDAW